MTSTPPIGTKFFTWFSPSRIGNDGRPDWFPLFSQSPRTPFCEPTVQRHAATRLHQPPIQGRSTHKLTAPIIFEDGILTKDEAIAFTKVGKKTFEDLYGFRKTYETDNSDSHSHSWDTTPTKSMTS